jgi:predicted class III extradiol MEMO1 family dioxygenase
LCLVILWGLDLSEASGQNKVYKVFLKSEWQQDFDSLRSIYSSNKIFVKEYELQSLIALSYYPELKNVPITFKYHDIKTTMEVRPEFASAIKNHNRKYIIFIDNNVHSNEGLLLKDVPFNAQIGVIGHELAHIMDFEKRSIKSLLLLAIDYVTLKNHARYERSIDEYAIQRGLGWQELEFADFMQNRSNVASGYKRFKQINYMSSSEISAEIAKINLYSSFETPKKLSRSINEKQ